jgi:hypothetical protein
MSNRRYDALGQDPQRMFSRSQSQDNIAEQQYGPYSRPKPRSSSYGSTYSTNPNPRRTSNESSHHRQDSQDYSLHSSYIHFPTSHVESVEIVSSETLTTNPRTKKLSNTSINATVGHKTAAHQTLSATRTSHQHPTVLQPVNTHTYTHIPSNEQLAPRSRKSSSQIHPGVAIPSTSASRPVTAGSSTYLSPANTATVQPTTSPHNAIYSTTSPLPSSSKPLPPKPVLESETNTLLPEPYLPTQNQPQAQASGSRRSQVMNANMIVDPNTIPQESITVHGSRSSSVALPLQSAYHAFTGRRSVSGGNSDGSGGLNSPNPSTPYGTTPTHQRQQSNSNSQPQTHSLFTQQSQYQVPSSTSRNPDTVLYPRTYSQTDLSDSFTAVVSTRTPRLRRTSGARVLGTSGGISTRPTTPNSTN